MEKFISYWFYARPTIGGKKNKKVLSKEIKKFSFETSLFKPSTFYLSSSRRKKKSWWNGKSLDYTACFKDNNYYNLKYGNVLSFVSLDFEYIF